MSLSCSCDYDYEYEAGEWYYDYGYTIGEESYFVPLATNRRKRCCSCNELINIGSLCNIYPRARYPHNEIESRITNGCDLEGSLCDEATIPMANHYHCKGCAEIWLNLTDIGYECLWPNENMMESLKEYHQISGFR